MKKYFILPLLASCFIVSCKRLCFMQQYALDYGTVNLSPQSDSIKVGDTLIVSYEFPTVYYFNDSTSIIDFSNAENVGTGINIVCIPRKGELAGAIDSFNIFSLIGSLHPDPNHLESTEALTFSEIGGKYLMKFGLIAAKRGLYVLAIGGLPQIQKKCNRASVSVRMTNVDHHSYILEQLYYPGAPDGDYVSDDAKASNYCFKVY